MLCTNTCDREISQLGGETKVQLAEVIAMGDGFMMEKGSGSRLSYWDFHWNFEKQESLLDKKAFESSSQ